MSAIRARAFFAEFAVPSRDIQERASREMSGNLREQPTTFTFLDNPIIEDYETHVGVSEHLVAGTSNQAFTNWRPWWLDGSEYQLLQRRIVR